MFNKEVELKFNSNDNTIETLQSYVNNDDYDVDELCIICAEFIKYHYTKDGIKKLMY